MASVTVRVEEPDDRDQVRDLHLLAFGDHGHLVVELVERLRESQTSENGLSLVAAEGSVVIGHVLFSRGLVDAPRRLVDVQVLSPLAVLPDRQRQGVGTALIRRGLEELVERSVPLVFVEGDPGYYARAGFLPATSEGFRKPSLRIPDEAFQVIRLPASEPWMSGTLVYSQAFWDSDAVGLRG